MGPKLAAIKLDTLAISIRAGGFRVPLQESVREVLIPQIEETFDTEGRGTWPRLKASTIARRAYADYTRGRGPVDSGPILNAVGRLRNAATAYERWRVRDDEAMFTGLPGYAHYGVYHLSGRTGSNPMPIRNWATWDRDTEDQVAKIFDRWLDFKIEAVF